MIPGTTIREILGHKTGGANPFFLIAGPCVIESRELILFIAEKLCQIRDKLQILVIFKASFDKANRSSVASFRGPGMAEGLEILAQVKRDFSLPLLTDIHEIAQVAPVSEVVDMVQIPAFLSRQTDLVLAAARKFKYINVKKGQFIAPEDAINIIKKIQSTGNQNYYITERGYTFGYNNLIVDPRSFEIMRKMDIPVIFDASHSVQMPGGGLTSGGNRDFIRVQARAAVASGLEGLFMEVHPQPEKGLSDSSNMFYLDQLEGLIRDLLRIDATVKRR